ncbi:translation initiation factor IF-2 [Candidatus Nitromaritima sp. SCGC AAA799-C22]|nr:translation initiation factor IF-2 [Candidatus Nitromaritima sp. SCGC AAA799-C22]
MGKIRINKLALELNVQNDQILDALHKKGFSVKNYMSSINAETADEIREFFNPKPKPKTSTKSSKSTKAKKTAAKSTPAKSATAKKAAAKPSKETKKKTEPAKKTVRAVKSAGKAKAVKEPTGKAKKKAEPAKKTVKAVKSAGKAKAVKEPAGKAKKKAEPAKIAKKAGLKIVKHEEKAKEAEKKPAPVKEKPKAKTAKPVKEEKAPPTPRPEPAPVPVEVEEEGFELVQLPENIMVRDLGEKLNCSPNEVIKELMELGIMTTINQSLSFEVAAKVADQRGFEVELVKAKSALDFEEEEEDRSEDLTHRSPIVTIMGHVDHGKTSLLDAIRKTNLTDSEEGGITQHIGAYRAKVKDQHITFLDTPGHEAFTAMRARGAQVTDIVILVVAADDGLKPQTKEAIDHANAGNVPILVAINKVDKPDAKPEEVKKQLADQGLLPEDWGGQTIYAEVSALQKTGIDHLLEMILLQAEVLELKANPKLRPQGVVIESKLDKGRGPVATVIVQKGTLEVGQPFVVGPYFGKVRALINEKGSKIPRALPAMPVEVVGLPEVPQPGDKFYVVADERKARQYSDMRLQQRREVELAESARITMEDLHQQIVEGKIKELNLIIKADAQGSIAAVQEAFTKLETREIRIKVIHDGVGGITESDVLLSSASNAIIIGFNVRPTDKADVLATREKVDIRMYSVIYDAIDDIKKALEGLLAPKFKERIVGRAEVRKVFSLPKIGSVAGCQVTQGKIERNLDARLIRDSVVVYEGKILSLRRFKDDVKEVVQGYECGLSFDKYQDLKQGDVVEPFVLEEVAH